MDTYDSFAALSRQEREGVDFRIVAYARPGGVAIIAPHGGHIEPQTSRLAHLIAGDVFSFYAFEGLAPGSFPRLHITSARFDEPRCLRLVAASDRVVALHGCKGDIPLVYVGGRDLDLGRAIAAQMALAGIMAATPPAHLAGLDRTNICNRGRRGAGVQLEMTRALRDAAAASPAVSARLAGAVRQGILNLLGGGDARGD